MTETEVAKAARILLEQLPTTMKLTEIYHALYDVKDQQNRAGQDTYTIYEALSVLERVMIERSMTAPARYDLEGRQDA